MKKITYLKQAQRQLKTISIQYRYEVRAIIQHQQTEKQVKEILYMELLFLDKLKKIIEEIEFISNLN